VLAGPFDYAWEVPRRGMPEGLRRRLFHARSFSALARALSLVYYDMLLAKKAAKSKANAHRDDRDELAEAFEFWWKEGRPLVAGNWDLKQLQQEVGLDRCGTADLRFLADSRQVITSGGSAPKLFHSSTLRRLIEERERRQRPTKCRLCGRPEHRRYLENWERAPGRLEEPFQLHYRHRPGDTITRDLLRKPYSRKPDVQD
jgi:hypothetical protein